MKQLKLIPLGGIGDVTKNMYVYEYGDEQLIVDCGIGFPSDAALGVDVVIPDISYLEKTHKNILGIVLTHGHMDHIGGLPYILPRLPKVDIYGSTLTIALAEQKVREFGLTNKLIPVEDHINLGSFDIKLIHSTHSIPNCKHLFIKTPVANIYHAADFKFDLTPIDNNPSDLSSMAKAGDEGVDLLLTDSLRVESPGFTPTERTLLAAVDNAVKMTKGKFIFTTISSSISRIGMAIDASLKYNRKVALIGRSISNNCLAAAKHGFLNLPPESIVDAKKVRHYKPNQITLIVAGSQGQEGSAMQRLAAGEHQFVQLHSGDHVVISADAIPGTESDVFGLIDTLYRQEIQVSYSGSTPGLHVSGHGHRGDLTLLARLVRPRHIVPIGGAIRHLHLYRDLATEMGYDKDRVHILDDGQVLGISRHEVKVVDKIITKNVYVDGLGIGDVGNVVLRDRQVMAEDGILLAIVPVNKDNGQVSGHPEIVTRGFVYVKESQDLIKSAEDKVVDCLHGQHTKVTDWNFLRHKIENVLEKFLYDATNRRPLIIAMVIEV